MEPCGTPAFLVQPLNDSLLQFFGIYYISKPALELVQKPQSSNIASNKL